MNKFVLESHDCQSLLMKMHYNILKLFLLIHYPIFYLSKVKGLPSVSFTSTTCLIMFDGINFMCLYNLALFSLDKPELHSLELLS